MTIRMLLAAGLMVTGTIAYRPARVTQVVGDTEHDTSTIDDQVDLAITVYNSDIALIRDVAICDCRAARPT